MVQQEKLFETLSPGRLFLRCAAPSAISMAVTSLYTVADGIFVGQFVGEDALAAVNLVMPLILMSFALADMVAVGSSVQIALRLGAKEAGAASRIFSFCSGLIVLISCVVGMAGYFLAGPALRLMGAQPSVASIAVEYLQVYAVFSPAIMIFFAVDNYLRICGRVRYSMVLNVMISILNIALDFLFVVILKKGAASAAFASCLSLTLGTALGFLPFIRGKLPLRFVKGGLPPRLLGNILANGSSEFFSNIAGSVMMLALNGTLLRISGSMAVAAFSIVMYVDSVADAMVFGMADSLQPALSYNYGAKQRKRVFALEKWVLAAGAAMSAAAMAVMLAGGEGVIALFVQKGDAALLEMSERAMRLFSVCYLVKWLGTCLSSFFTALGRAGYSLVLAFCRTLVFPLISLGVLPPLLGLDGVWLTPAAAGMLAAVLAVAFLLLLVRNEKKRSAFAGFDEKLKS